MGGVIHVAGVQLNPTILTKETNLADCLESVRDAAQLAKRTTRGPQEECVRILSFPRATPRILWPALR